MNNLTRSIKLAEVGMLFSATIFFIPLLEAQSAFPGQLLRCTESEQCTVVEGLCGGWMVVNKRHEKDYSEHIVEGRRSVDCDGVPSGPRPKPVCSQGYCEDDKLPGSGLNRATIFREKCPRASGDIGTSNSKVEDVKDLGEYLNHPLSHIRNQGLEIISRLGPKAAATAPLLVELLRRTVMHEEQRDGCWFGITDEERLFHSIVSIGEGASVIVPSILQLIPDERSYHQRAKFIDLLASIGPHAKAAAEFVNECLTSWINKGDFGNSSVKPCVHAARRIREPLFAPHLARISELESTNRLDALHALYTVDSKGNQFEQTAQGILGSQACQEQKLVIRLLGLHPDRHVDLIDEIADAATKQNWCSAGDQAIRVLGNYGHRAQSVSVSWKATLIEGSLADVKFRALLKIFPNDELISDELEKAAFDSFKHYEAMRILRAIDTERSRNIIIKAAVSFSLPRTVPADGWVPQLKERLMQPQPTQGTSFRTAALMALRYMLSAEELIPLLEKLVTDSSVPVARDASGMLLSMTAIPHPGALAVIVQAIEKDNSSGAITSDEAFAQLKLVPSSITEKLSKLLLAQYSEASDALSRLASNGDTAALSIVKSAFEANDKTAIFELFKSFGKQRRLPAGIDADRIRAFLGDGTTHEASAVLLEEIGSPEALQILEDFYLSDN